MQQSRKNDGRIPFVCNQCTVAICAKICKNLTLTTRGRGKTICGKIRTKLRYNNQSDTDPVAKSYDWFE